MQIKVKTPAKINLSLDILGKREDGFHEIKSVMQMINLYDYLTFDIEENDVFQISLSGNNLNIPYNEKNIVYKAIKLFIDKVDVKPHKFNVYIEKNIPTEAGLAGGSSNAVGTFLVLNKFFNNPLSDKDLHGLCAMLGSDLNVCLLGGCSLATGRGETVEKLPYREYPVSLIKPNLGISAKEGYQRYADLQIKDIVDYSSIIVDKLENNLDISEDIHNDLELGVLNVYDDLQKIKIANPNSIMSGSGSTYFVLKNKINSVDNFWISEGLKTISTGCEII